MIYLTAYIIVALASLIVFLAAAKHSIDAQTDQEYVIVAAVVALIAAAFWPLGWVVVLSVGYLAHRPQ